MLEMMLGNTLAAAALAVIVVVLCRTLRPSPAARHALWLVVVVKLVSPIGLMWALPLPFEGPRLWEEPKGTMAAESIVVSKQRWIAEEPVVLTTFFIEAIDPSLVDFPAEGNDEFEVASIVPPDIAPPENHQVESARNSDSLYVWLAIVWLAGAIVAASRYARRTIRFSRFARSGKQASPSLNRQVAEMAATLRVRAPEVRILADLPSPVVWCLFRPVLLWPKGLQDQLSAGGRQAVLVHELAHLRRRDHWVRWLELAAAVIYWWNPVFWLARRQMRFHAELACDAWVTGTLPSTRRDYAEALLEVCARSNRAAAPSPAVGVGGEGRRDFQRRLTMIMREQVPCRLAAGVKLFVVLLLTAALPAWTLGQAKPQPKAEPEQGLKIELKGIDFAPLVLFAEPSGDADKKVKELELRIADLKKQLDALKGKSPAQKPGVATFQIENFKIFGADVKSEPKTANKPEQPLGAQIRWVIEEPAQPKYKVIGADGKEIQGAKVFVLDKQPKQAVNVKVPSKTEPVQVHVRTTARITGEGSGDVINLTRTTYALSKEKASTLAAFLKDNVKTGVLEVKVEEMGLTVTTTPDTQAAIKAIVKLMGHGEGRPLMLFRIAP